MEHTYNFFKFLRDKKGEELPFIVRLNYEPDSLYNSESVVVNEDVDLNGVTAPNLTKLPDNFHVNGNLYLQFLSNFKKLPNGLTANRLYIKKLHIDSLPEDLNIKELNLNDEYLIKTIPALSLENLSIRRCKNIISIDPNMKINNEIDIISCEAFNNFPLTKYRHLTIARTSIKSILPYTIASSLYIDDCLLLMEIGNGISIEHNLSIKNCPNLKSLGNNLYVGFALTIYNTGITELPADIRVEGVIYTEQVNIDKWSKTHPHLTFDTL